MYRNFSITEKEKRQILEMHQSKGYKMSLNESQADSLAKTAMQMAKSGQVDKNMKTTILGCIKSGSYSHLMILTTGAGATVLGALAALFVSGVGTLPALILMAAGVLIATIEGMMTTSGSGAGSVADELEQLYNCVNSKK